MTRLENKRRARYKKMGGQGKPPPLQWRSLFDSDAKKADEGVIVVKSGADCDAAGTPRKKKLHLPKRHFRRGSWDKRRRGRRAGARLGCFAVVRPYCL